MMNAILNFSIVYCNLGGSLPNTFHSRIYDLRNSHFAIFQFLYFRVWCLDLLKAFMNSLTQFFRLFYLDINKFFLESAKIEHIIRYLFTMHINQLL